MNGSHAAWFLILALVALSCGAGRREGGGESGDGQPPVPAAAEVCFEAMDRLEFPAGSTMIGVEEMEGGCAVSVRFPKEDDAESFLKLREDEGLSRVSISFERSDGDAVEIPLQVKVRDRTVNAE